MVDGKTIQELKDEMLMIRNELVLLQKRLDEFEKLKPVIDSEDFQHFIKSQKSRESGT